MAMGFKFRLTKNSKSRFISLEGKGRLILGIVFIVVVTSALRHAVLNKKMKDAEDADGKKSAGADGKKGSGAAAGADRKKDKKEEGPIDKKTGLPHFIKRIIMPAA